MLIVTKKNESSHQRHSRQKNDGKVIALGSLFGVAVELTRGIADKTTIKLTYARGLWASKLAAKEVLPGEQNLHSSHLVWYVRIQLELILD